MCTVVMAISIHCVYSLKYMHDDIYAVPKPAVDTSTVIVIIAFHCGYILSNICTVLKPAVDLLVRSIQSLRE